MLFSQNTIFTVLAWYTNNIYCKKILPRKWGKKNTQYNILYHVYNWYILVSQEDSAPFSYFLKDPHHRPPELAGYGMGNGTLCWDAY